MGSTTPVSYTHLDVYKRQIQNFGPANFCRNSAAGDRRLDRFPCGGFDEDGFQIRHDFSGRRNLGSRYYHVFAFLRCGGDGAVKADYDIAVVGGGAAGLMAARCV